MRFRLKPEPAHSEQFPSQAESECGQGAFQERDGSPSHPRPLPSRTSERRAQRCSLRPPRSHPKFLASLRSRCPNKHSWAAVVSASSVSARAIETPQASSANRTETDDRRAFSESSSRMLLLLLENALDGLLADRTKSTSFS